MIRRISLIGSVVAALALTAPALGQGSGSGVEKPPWQTALEARSQALNKQYGLGIHAKAKPQRTVRIVSTGSNGPCGSEVFVTIVDGRPGHAMC